MSLQILSTTEGLLLGVGSPPSVSGLARTGNVLGDSKGNGLPPQVRFPVEDRPLLEVGTSPSGPDPGKLKKEVLGSMLVLRKVHKGRHRCDSSF